MECHARYHDSDFTSRYFVPQRLMQPAADGSVLLHSRDAYVSGKRVCGTSRNPTKTRWLLDGERGHCALARETAARTI